MAARKVYRGWAIKSSTFWFNASGTVKRKPMAFGLNCLSDNKSVSYGATVNP